MSAIEAIGLRKTYGTGRSAVEAVTGVDLAIDYGQTDGDDFWVLLNMYDEPATFDLAEWQEQSDSQHDWHRIIDTAPWAEAEGNSTSEGSRKRSPISAQPLRTR